MYRIPQTLTLVCLAALAAATPQITPAPDLAKRADSTSNPLVDGICATPYMHTEGAWFLAAWLGCDRWRVDCCVPGYTSYAPWQSLGGRAGSASDFRVTACPTGFSSGTLAASDMPSGVSGVCCPPGFSPLPSFGADYYERGAVCTRAMTGNEAVQSATYPVVLPNPTVNSVQDFQTAPNRFKNRFQAIGYYLDPSATEGTYSGPSTAVAAETGVRTVTAVITTVITRAASADRQGLPAGGVAGVAVGSVVAGVLVGAAMMWGLFRRKAGGSEGDTRPVWARTGEVENKPLPSEMEVGFSGTELEDTSPMKGASAG